MPHSCRWARHTESTEIKESTAKKRGTHTEENRYFWDPGGTWTANDYIDPEVRNVICTYEGMGACLELGKARIGLGILVNLGGGVSPKMSVPSLQIENRDHG